MLMKKRVKVSQYYFSKYEEIYNARDLRQAKEIALEEMKEISDKLATRNKVRIKGLKVRRSVVGNTKDNF